LGYTSQKDGIKKFRACVFAWKLETIQRAVHIKNQQFMGFEWQAGYERFT